MSKKQRKQPTRFFNQGARPMNQQQKPPSAQVQIDIEKLPQIGCMACGHKEFIQITHLRRLTKIMSPNGQEGIINANMLKCGNPECGKMFDPKAYQRWEEEQEKNRLRLLEAKETLAANDKAEASNTVMCRQCGSVHQVDTECPECASKKEN